jgi:hypothetical protein
VAKKKRLTLTEVLTSISPPRSASPVSRAQSEHNYEPMSLTNRKGEKYETFTRNDRPGVKFHEYADPGGKHRIVAVPAKPAAKPPASAPGERAYVDPGRPGHVYVPGTRSNAAGQSFRTYTALDRPAMSYHEYFDENNKRRVVGVKGKPKPGFSAGPPKSL